MENVKAKWMYFHLKLSMIIIIVVIGISYWINSIGLDLEFSGRFFENGKWIIKHSQPWQFFYDYGTIPAILLSVSGLFVIILSFIKDKLIKYRKIGIFVVMTMALGPGLVVNSIFKDHWGRPRPRHVQEFNGKQQFLEIGEKGIAGSGKSFPCGHASMGFYLITPLFFIRKSKYQKIGFAVLGIVMGGLIGYARIIQGGHFLSDAIWAGVFVYLVDSLCFYTLKMHENIYWVSRKKVSKKMNKFVISILVIILIGLLYFFMTTIPYYKAKKMSISADELKNYKEIVIDIPEVSAKISFSDSLFVDFSAQGFGLPNAKISFKKIKEDDRFSLAINEKGKFSEIHKIAAITLPLDKIGKIKFLHTSKMQIENFSELSVIEKGKLLNALGN